MTIVIQLKGTLKDHKIAVYCNGELYAEEAIAEIERMENTLHTESGTEFFPERVLENGMYASENSEILVNCYSESEKSGAEFENLYTSTGQIWGFVLPFRTDSLIGRLTDHVDKMTLTEKRMIAIRIVNCFREKGLTDSIYLFRTESDIAIQPIGGNYITSAKELYLLLYELFFEHAPQKDRMSSIVEDRMKYGDYPGCIFEFFEFAFADKIYPGLSCIPATVDFLENTLYRMAFTAREV